MAEVWLYPAIPAALRAHREPLCQLAWRVSRGQTELGTKIASWYQLWQLAWTLLGKHE